MSMWAMKLVKNYMRARKCPTMVQQNGTSYKARDGTCSEPMVIKTIEVCEYGKDG